MKSVRDHSQARVIKPTGTELASIVAIAHTLLPKPTHTPIHPLPLGKSNTVLQEQVLTLKCLTTNLTF